MKAPVFVVDVTDSTTWMHVSSWLRAASPQCRVYRPHFDNGALALPSHVPESLDFQSSLEEAGALLENIRQCAPDAIFDFSGRLSSCGLVDACRALGIPTWGPGLRGMALERVRSLGQTFLRSAVPHHRGIAIPPSVVLQRPPVAWRDLYATHGPKVVCKEESGYRIDRVRFAEFAEQFAYLLYDMHYPLQVQSYVPGIEIGFYVAVTRSSMIPLAVFFEHKRALTGDHGALTGEMGTVVVPTTDAWPDRWRRLFSALWPGLFARGYTGLLEINTRYDPTSGQWWFLEFSCRQSDPGWITLMHLLECEDHGLAGSALLSWVLPGESPLSFPVSWALGTSVAVCGAGYPHAGTCAQNLPIAIEGSEVPEETFAYYGAEHNAVTDTWMTRGGRHVIAIGRGTNAIASAKHAAARVQFAGRQFRLDIGKDFEQQQPILQRAGFLL